MDIVNDELKIINFWEKNKIFEKSVKQRPVTKQYVFYDGPPFATGTPHYGHILGLTSKDVFPRFWTMKGFRCERRWGWDCHGLPIENLAEKDLKISEKKEIEAGGVDKFNAYCRSKVLGYAEDWGKVVRRMGKWIEFDNSYKTMDKSYMETIWFIFKKLYDKKLIYEGKKILMYCPRCETPISKAEIAMDNSYKTVTEKSIIVSFKLKGEKNTFLLAWTTTPWTLIGNAALAVNSRMDYVNVKVGSNYFVLCKESIGMINGEKYKIVDEFKGKELVGKGYEPLYETAEGKAYVVVNGGKSVSSEEGTGIVHLALYGEFDYDIIKKNKLSIVQHLDEKGRLIKGPEEWLGEWFKDLDKNIIADLDNKNLLFKKLDFSHSYPFCYRCETPLFYNAVDSWFINIEKIRDKLLKESKKINWYPAGKVEKRFEYIIKTAPDWTISRNRFWATAIPVWKCSKCDEIRIIGSIDELRKNAVEKIPKNIDLHKDVMDNIHLKCSKCGSVMNRVPEVIDCWLESGSMPYSAKHYPFENEGWFKTNFPADFISEYIGQVRAWFYYMHVMGVLMFGKPAFKNVVVTGNILAEDGSKMSKSKKNYPDPNRIFEEYGADALRFYLMNSPLMRAQDLNFKETGLKEIYRKVIVLLSNVSNFYFLFSGNNKNFADTNSKHVLDKWIMSCLNSFVKNVTYNFEVYDTVNVCDNILLFIDDLSTWYVRRSRDRFKDDDKDAVRTLAYVLNVLIRVMAPITPFIAENNYQKFRNLNKDLYESVHLESWPEYETNLVNVKVEEIMKEVRSVVSKGLEQRDKAGINVRQPLEELIVKGVEFSNEYCDLIKDELNVKNVKFEDGDIVSVELNTVISHELLMEGVSRELTRIINNERKKMKLTIKNRIKLYLNTEDELLRKSAEVYKKNIMNSVQADELIFGSYKNEKSVKINNKESNIAIELL